MTNEKFMWGVSRLTSTMTGPRRRAKPVGVGPVDRAVGRHLARAHDAVSDTGSVVSNSHHAEGPGIDRGSESAARVDGLPIASDFARLEI